MASEPISHDDVITRRLVALIIGVLGLAVLIDVAIIATVNPDANLDGFRQVMFVIVGGLLVAGGVLAFVWPNHSIDKQRQHVVNTELEATDLPE